jgi:hypothetical protein
MENMREPKRTERLGWGMTVVLAAGALGWAGGCAEPSKRLNAPPQGASQRPAELQETFVPMTDNELLSDMSMSSIHFVPHQAELNSTGVRRLTRYAEILKCYGGTLKYDGVEEQELMKPRLARLEDFLACSGVPKDKFKVEAGLAGGTGGRADEAIANNQSKEIGAVRQLDDSGTDMYRFGNTRIPAQTQDKAANGNNK